MSNEQSDPKTETFIDADKWTKAGRDTDQDFNAKRLQEAKALDLQGQAAMNNLISAANDRLKNGDGQYTGELALVNAVDNVVNDKIKYANDTKFFGLLEVENWKTGAETARDGVGDCEDFAILKADMLMKMGVPAQQLSIMSLAPRSNGNSGHAVCTYKDKDGMQWVLNNSGEEKGRFTGMMPLSEYLESSLAGGSEMVPLGEYSMAEGKYQPNPLIHDGKLNVAQALAAVPKPMPSLAELEASSGFKELACQIVAKMLGNGAQADNFMGFMERDPPKFAELLKEAMQNPDNMPDKIRSSSDIKMITDYLNHYVAKVEKRASEQGAAQPQQARSIDGEILTQGTGEPLAAKALVSVGAPEVTTRSIDAGGNIGPAVSAQIAASPVVVAISPESSNQATYKPQTVGMG